jgi:hypothetical protein
MASLEFCQTLGERSNRGTVIQGMPCQYLAPHFDRRLGKRDKIAWPYQAGNFAGLQSGIYQQVFKLHWPGTVIRGEQMGRRLDYQTWQVSPPVHGDDLPREHTRVEASHLGEVQEAIGHPSDHQTNCIHMGGDKQATAWLGSRTALQGVQAAQATDGDLVSQRLPGSLYVFPDGRLVPGQARHGNQLLQKGKDIGHGFPKFGYPSGESKPFMLG